MPIPNGYLIGTGIFLAALVVMVSGQTLAKKFHPFLYWATIVASTTAGTTMADFFDRSLGIGYTGGASSLFILVLLSLGAWYWSEGTVSVNTVNTPRVEVFYWVTITFSQTLGTALGDWAADTGGLGYGDGVLVFAAALALIALAYFFTKIIACGAVLDGLHPHPAIGRNGGRFSRQAGLPTAA